MDFVERREGRVESVYGFRLPVSWFGCLGESGDGNRFMV